MRKNVKRVLLLIALCICSVNPAHAQDKNKSKPNILWIMSEDISPDLSCYGVKGVHTPNLDKLAKEGIRYELAFSTSPVCSTSRSAMMVGVHQQLIGAHQHRTKNKKPLENKYKPFVHLLEDAGYYTCLVKSGKTDLNFKWGDRRLFNGRDWKGRKKGQPFFAQMTFQNTHRRWKGDPINPVDVNAVELPPYYPDTKLLRKDWAMGLGEIQVMDRGVGQVIKRLKDEGILDNTVIFFIGDHGRCHIRGKQFMYEGGVRIPMIMWWPKGVPGGQVNRDLVQSIDITKTILKISGAKVPRYLQGIDLLDPSEKKRKTVFASRGKMDDTHDAMRMVRSKDFKYILNLMPERAWMQYNRYKTASYPAVAVMNVMYMKGELNDAQAKFMARTKPREELYDLKNDPHELNNLAQDKKYEKVLKQMRSDLKVYQKLVGEQGVSQAFRKGGWSDEYPYKTLEQWEEMVKVWEGRILEGKPWAPKKRNKGKKNKK